MDYDSRHRRRESRGDYNVELIEPDRLRRSRSAQGADSRHRRRERRGDYNVGLREPDPLHRSRSARRSGHSYHDDDAMIIQIAPHRSRSTGVPRARPDSGDYSYIVPAFSSRRERHRVRDDLDRIRYYSTSQRAPQHVRNFMAETHEVSSRSEIHPGLHGTGGAAYTSRRFRNQGPSHHEVHYQGQVEDEGQRIGNLTHELTHASIGERFGRDYVSYTNSPRREVENRRFNPAGNRMVNELDRQNQQRVPQADNAIRVQLEDLQRRTHEDNGLTSEQKRYIIERLNYGLQSPHTEFDTIINQIATRLHIWGVTSAQSKLARKIERLGSQQHSERMSGNRIVSSTIRRPTYRPGMKEVKEKKPSFLRRLFGR